MSIKTTQTKTKLPSVKSVATAIWVTSVTIVIVAVLFMLIPPFNNGGEVDSGLFSDYSTFVGGMCAIVMGILNAYLIFRAYQAQQQQAADSDLQYVEGKKRQDNFFKTERFENRFFEMMRANRKIVEEMAYEVPDEYEPAPRSPADPRANKHSIILIHGQRVFVQIYKHFLQAKSECEWIRSEYVNAKDMFVSDDLYLREVQLLQRYHLNLGASTEADDEMVKSVQWINIIYMCIFFGLASDGRRVIEKHLLANYKPDLVSKVMRTLALKPVIWSKYYKNHEWFVKNGFSSLRNPEKIAYEDKDYKKYYGGHQHRLGHYFRNIYNIYTYLDSRTDFKWKEKYTYAKQFRSQLSTYEQAIFFYNSLSTIGRVWEIEGGKKSKHRIEVVNRQLITKYNIIKNIPAELLSDDMMTTIYPMVNFELHPKPLGKKELKKLYR